MLCTQRENGRRVPPEGVLARTPAPAGGAWRPWDSSHAALGRAPPRPQCPVVCQDLVLFLFPGAGGGAASGTPRSPTRVSNDENEPLLNTLMLRARVQARETDEAESLPRVRETVATHPAAPPLGPGTRETKTFPGRKSPCTSVHSGAARRSGRRG